MEKKPYDAVIVGAGVVGLTLALELKRRHPKWTIAVFEKETSLGRHASGRNSGVLHSGIYYEAGTLKARVCSLGNMAMQRYALEKGIRMEKRGKVIVATSPDRAREMEILLKRAEKNNIRAELISQERLKEIEPYARTCGNALHVPDTAIIDVKAVMEELGKDARSAGIDLSLKEGVININPEKRLIETRAGHYGYSHLINCAGVHADSIAHMFGVGMRFSIIPFRGSYHKLSQAKNNRVRGNIYPAPDLRQPFLGVHLTRSIDGDVYAGPTAMPALGRENYVGIRGISPIEAISITARLAMLYYRNRDGFRGLVHEEIRKLNKKGFLRDVQLLVPDIKEMDIEACGKVGIRPQLVNTGTWRLETDFVIEGGHHSTHILNAISPAFTGAFEFSRIAADTVDKGV